MNTEEIEDDPTDLIEEEPQTPPEPKPEPTDDLKEAVRELTRITTENAKPRPEPEKELTQDQKDELWAVYNPKKAKPDFMKKFFRLNPDATAEEEAEAESLFADMQKGFVRQAVKGSMNISAAEIAKLREEIKPLQEFYSKAQARELRSRFSDEYPDFADAKYEKLLAAADRAVAGQNFPDEKSYFKAVAETAADTLKSVQPDFVLGAAKTKPTKTTGQTARGPRMSSGSTSGAGGGNGGGKVVDDLDGIFDI